METRLYVVTGGPGAGKTTLIEALAARGVATTEEAGRAVIRDEMARGGEALPWGDRTAFAARMAEKDHATYRAAVQGGGLWLFDRGIPDTIGYLRLCGLPVPEALDTLARTCRYARHVFVAPPWRAIFAQDDERKQNFAEAEATCAMMREVYAGYGYASVDLPLASVDARVALVLERTK